VADPCTCGHAGGPGGVHEYIEDEGDPDELAVCTVEGCGCIGFEDAAEARARKVAAFAAHGPRYARLAEELIGTKDPMFALAHLVVDHEARIDGLVGRVAHLEARLPRERS
jgi:hypothetical protein